MPVLPSRALPRHGQRQDHAASRLGIRAMSVILLRPPEGRQGHPPESGARPGPQPGRAEPSSSGSRGSNREAIRPVLMSRRDGVPSQLRVRRVQGRQALTCRLIIRVEGQRRFEAAAGVQEGFRFAGDLSHLPADLGIVGMGFQLIVEFHDQPPAFQGLIAPDRVVAARSVNPRRVSMTQSKWRVSRSSGAAATARLRDGQCLLPLRSGNPAPRRDQQGIRVPRILLQGAIGERQGFVDAMGFQGRPGREAQYPRVVGVVLERPADPGPGGDPIGRS